MKTLLLSILCLGLVTAGKSQILFDDFNDGSIDGTKWEQILPFGQSSLVESGGTMTSAGRGILVASPHMPVSYSITGSFRRNSSIELFKIVLRSDLTLSPGLEGYSERKGIQIAFNDIPGVAIENHVSGGGVGPIGYPINVGQFYNFEILDDGANVSLSIDGSLVLSLATTDGVGDRVAFYSREFSNTSTTFDNITITAVPEPSALAISVLTGFLLLAKNRGIKLFKLAAKQIPVCILPVMVALLASCSPSSQEQKSAEVKQEQKPVDGRLDGDVFIVSQVGTPIKLALAKVKLFKEGAVASFLATNKGSILSQWHDAIAKYTANKIEMENSDSEWETRQRMAEIEDSETLTKMKIALMKEMSEAHTQAKIKLIQEGASEEMIQRAQDRFEATKKAQTAEWKEMDAKTKEERNNAKTQRAEKRARLDQAIKENSAKVTDSKSLLTFNQDVQSNLFSGFPAPIESQNSDADGKFSFTLSTKEKYVLFAVASRQVENQTEHYVWLVPVSLNGQSQVTLHLANDNLFSGKLNQPSQDLLH